MRGRECGRRRRSAKQRGQLGRNGRLRLDRVRGDGHRGRPRARPRGARRLAGSGDDRAVRRRLREAARGRHRARGDRRLDLRVLRQLVQHPVAAADVQRRRLPELRVQGSDAMLLWGARVRDRSAWQPGTGAWRLGNSRHAHRSHDRGQVERPGLVASFSALGTAVRDHAGKIPDAPQPTIDLTT